MIFDRIPHRKTSGTIRSMIRHFFLSTNTEVCSLLHGSSWSFSSEVLKLLALVMNHFSQVEFRGFPILQGIEIAHDDDRRIGMLLLDPDSQMVDILKGMPSASGTAISCKTNGDLNPLYPLSCRVSCLFSCTFSLIGSDNKNSRPTSCRASITPLSLQDCE